MRGLKMIPAARRNGRGPNSSLNVPGYSARFVCTMCVALRAFTHPDGMKEGVCRKTQTWSGASARIRQAGVVCYRRVNLGDDRVPSSSQKCLSRLSRVCSQAFITQRGMGSVRVKSEVVKILTTIRPGLRVCIQL